MSVVWYHWHHSPLTSINFSAADESVMTIHIMGHALPRLELYIFYGRYVPQQRVGLSYIMMPESRLGSGSLAHCRPFQR
jgi:hypothetical protein